MHPIRTAVLAVASAFAAAYATCAMSAPAEDTRTAPRYFDLVNASHESVVSFSVSPAGQDVYQDVVIDAPLRGGVTSTTVGLPDGGCLRDLRIAFGDGRTLIYPQIDVCRYRRLRLSHRDGRRAAGTSDRPVAATP